MHIDNLTGHFDLCNIFFFTEEKQNMAEKSLKEKINELEIELKIPIGFLWELRKEDDWSYIVKMHSLIEAAVAYLIVKKIDKPELERSISLLDLSNNKSGKIAFLKDLGVLEEFRNFIKKFSELRNKFVHNVSNINLSIDGILKEEKELRKGLINSIKPFIKNPVKIDDKEIPAINFIEENLKHSIFIAVLSMLEDIYFHTKRFYTLGELFGKPMGLLGTSKEKSEK